MPVSDIELEMLTPRMSQFAESQTIAMSRRARELMRQGRDIIKLSSGEPDLETPGHVRETAKQAIDQGLTRASNVDGLPELKRAVADKLKRENGLDYAEDEIIIGTGAKQVIANAVLATVGNGDEVIIPAPYWVSYPDMVRLAGGTPVFVDCRPERGFMPTPEDIEAVITPSTKWLVINNPNNPTGAVWDRDTLRGIADVLKRHPKVHVMTDDIYEHLVYDNAVVHTFAAIAPELKSRVLTINGVSKAFAMSGWRIGYGAGPVWLIKAMAKLQSQMTSNPTTVSQRAAIAALDGDPSGQDAYRATFKARRDKMAAIISATKFLDCHVPRGAFYVFADCNAALGRRTPDGKTLETDSDLTHYLLEQAGLAVVPGSAFGMGGYLRFSYAIDEAEIDRCAERLDKAMQLLS
ncbi:MAG: pyridoxal phosphate-dependent aminotransferase [Pseudomonadota bacterium]